jgi:hypothetical protein
MWYFIADNFEHTFWNQRYQWKLYGNIIRKEAGHESSEIISCIYACPEDTVRPEKETSAAWPDSCGCLMVIIWYT